MTSGVLQRCTTSPIPPCRLGVQREAVVPLWRSQLLLRPTDAPRSQFRAFFRLFFLLSFSESSGRPSRAFRTATSQGRNPTQLDGSAPGISDGVAIAGVSAPPACVRAATARSAFSPAFFCTARSAEESAQRRGGSSCVVRARPHAHAITSILSASAICLPALPQFFSAVSLFTLLSAERHILKARHSGKYTQW